MNLDRVQGLCERQDGCPGLSVLMSLMVSVLMSLMVSVLMSLMVSVDIKQHSAVVSVCP